MRTLAFLFGAVVLVILAAPVSAAPGGFAGNGLYVVGVDIEPGVYRSAGPADEFGCYWERLSGTSGDFDEIIANDFVLEGRTQVTIRQSDYAFNTEGCGAWTPA